jgi:hypothetical protein
MESRMPEQTQERNRIKAQMSDTSSKMNTLLRFATGSGWPTTPRK